MAFHLDRLKAIAKPRSEGGKASAQWRRENRTWLELSQDIALCIHYYLRTKGISKKDFAIALGVSPAYVSKLLRGEENLTLQTIVRIQKVLNTHIITIPQAKKQPSVTEESQLILQD